MNTVLIVVGIWIAVDVAIIATLSHLSGRRDPVAGPRSLDQLSAVPSAPALSRLEPAPRRLRLVGDPSSPAPDHRLRAVSHR